ncbi:MAG TPA: dienelactone hydrolase family protein [Stellaceae bacterium]|jgi:dienelactone hydrolase|nr:dienelactone hydrolase family protein [Stellaceae bacterium]
MTAHLARIIFLGILAIALATGLARAQEEYPPPQGMGRLVVVASGAMGMPHYSGMAKQIALLGYDVVLVDGNAMEGTQGAGLKTAIEAAVHMPHAIHGKIALVGFSLGGGIDLFYGIGRPDVIAGLVVWYPATSLIHDPAAWADRLQVPVLMFAGEQDNYKGCCLIDTAHKLAEAAHAAGKPFELITYPRTDHDFIPGNRNYNPDSFNDALQRTAARLKQYFGP